MRDLSAKGLTPLSSSASTGLEPNSASIWKMVLKSLARSASGNAPWLHIETMLNMIKRFSTDWRADALEGFRRMVADVLIGNGDNHLKNRSFIFPAPGIVRLSPAYDIVPTVLFAPRDTLGVEIGWNLRILFRGHPAPLSPNCQVSWTWSQTGSRRKSRSR